jgi:hypothetical protein
MKTYLVPVDFSDAAFNAADFAAQLSHQSDVKTIILMNAYYISRLRNHAAQPGYGDAARGGNRRRGQRTYSAVGTS